jgi:hypothetical protein
MKPQFFRSTSVISLIVLMAAPFLLPSCLAQEKLAQETLLPDNLDGAPPSRSVVPQESKLQSPHWAYNVWDANSKGVLTVGEAPQVGGKAVGIANLGPQPALQLYTVLKALKQGTTRFPLTISRHRERNPS